MAFPYIRAVVKIGTSIIAKHDCTLNTKYIASLAQQVRELEKKRIQPVFVISGAVTTGACFFRQKNENVDVFKRMCASVGQVDLIATFDRLFKREHVQIGQVLLTQHDLYKNKHSERLREVLFYMVSKSIVPILNENDVLELNSFGGNDVLTSAIAQLIQAQYILLLTDVDGVYNEDEEIIQTIAPNERVSLAEIQAQDARTRTGGMESKIKAAQEAAQYNIRTIIAHGKKENVLVRLLIEKERLGTHIH